MNNTSRRGLIVSIILHSCFFLILCFSFLWSNFNKKKVVRHTFQLQAIPQNIENIKIVSKVENKVIVETQKKVVKENREENKLDKAPIQKKTITYNDFVKNQNPNSKKQDNKKEEKLTTKTVDIPKIKTGGIENNLQRKLSSINTLTANELIEYETYLYAVIDAAWDCPKRFEGYKNSALFIFEVDVIGHITKVKIVKTSGSELFDESVAMAFKKVASVKPNPTGKTAEFQLTFSKK